MPNRNAIRSRSFELYPQSEAMRKRWVALTVYLIASGKHVMLTGKYPNKAPYRA